MIKEISPDALMDIYKVLGRKVSSQYLRNKDIIFVQAIKIENIF